MKEERITLLDDINRLDEEMISFSSQSHYGITPLEDIGRTKTLIGLMQINKEYLQAKTVPSTTLTIDGDYSDFEFRFSLPEAVLADPDNKDIIGEEANNPCTMSFLLCVSLAFRNIINEQYWKAKDTKSLEEESWRNVTLSQLTNYLTNHIGDGKLRSITYRKNVHYAMLLARNSSVVESIKTTGKKIDSMFLSFNIISENGQTGTNREKEVIYNFDRSETSVFFARETQYILKDKDSPFLKLFEPFSSSAMRSDTSTAYYLTSLLARAEQVGAEVTLSDGTRCRKAYISFGTIFDFYSDTNKQKQKRIRDKIVDIIENGVALGFFHKISLASDSFIKRQNKIIGLVVYVLVGSQ